MTDTELWDEYLSIMNDMAEVQSEFGTSMYGFNNRRIKIHKQISEYYKGIYKKFIQERFDEVCYNLDKIIDFKPPLMRNDSLKYYVKQISSKMIEGLPKLYVVGHIDNLFKQEHI